MASYLAGRIEKNKLNYNAVIAKYPECKEEIDEIILLDGYVINPDGTASKYNPGV